MPKIFTTYFTIPIITLIGLLLSWVFWLQNNQNLTQDVLLVTLIIGTLPLVYRIGKDLWAKHFGVDLIAITAIVGAFFLHQYLAGAVIVLMLSGGEALEVYALGRARKELSALVSNAPSVAHIKKPDGLVDVAASEVKVGDLIVLKPGEAAPVDGLVLEGISEVDESALTGESLPRAKTPGSLVLSGSINKENPLELKTVRVAAESKYEQIIKLVKEAAESRAPVVRLADRYSIWFTVVTFVLATASWLMSHDPIRLLAVLVVATPCPLILATPIAIMSGISRSASRGIIVKNGGALETLADINAFIFDKTGTLTLGEPKVEQVNANSVTEKEVLRIAASLDQVSTHILARSVVNFARKAGGVVLDFPKDFRENFGEGVSGVIDGKKYLFGKLSFLEKNGIAIPPEILERHEQRQNAGKIAVYLGAEGKLLGSIILADEIRPEIKKMISDIHRQGVKQMVMLTGDKKNVADRIAGELGLDDIHAECLPDQKMAEIKDHQKQFGKVAMVGDGVNDAPALAAADVGIALGGHGSTASASAGDIVITLDNLERVGEALAIAKRTLMIAKQSIFVGIGFSVVLMIIAALGYIVPVYGAILQEVLDVLVILNALRVNFGEI